VARIASHARTFGHDRRSRTRLSSIRLSGKYDASVNAKTVVRGAPPYLTAEGTANAAGLSIESLDVAYPATYSEVQPRQKGGSIAKPSGDHAQIEFISGRPRLCT